MEVTSLLPRIYTLWLLRILMWILVLDVAVSEPNRIDTTDHEKARGLGVVHPRVEITPLCHDGVLASKHGRVRALAGRWTILVSLDTPTIPTGLKQGIHEVVHFANRVKVSSEVKDSWFRRLDRIQLDLSPLPNVRTNNPLNDSYTAPSLLFPRNKRGWLDPLGEFVHQIIGVATDSQIRHVKKIIRELQTNEEAIVHKVNQLTTVVNRSRLYEAENRNFLTELADRFRQVQVTLGNTTTDINELRLLVSMERIIEDLEIKGDTLRQMRGLFAHRQQDLQARTLTPELLPTSSLQAILKQISSYHTQALQDVNWYYSFAQVRPMWAVSELLVYEIEIPLVRPVEFILYEIQSWPVPISRDLSATMVENGRYAYDSNSGQLFEAVRCWGSRPQICVAGALYGVDAPPCIRGILKGDQSLMEHCHLSVSSGNATKLYQVHDNKYIVTTWGESLTAMCTNQNVKIIRLTRGTYEIVLPPSCSLSNPSWTISAILYHHLDYHLASKQLPRPYPLNLTSLLQPHLKNYLSEPPMTTLGRVAPVSIAALKGLSLKEVHWTDTIDTPTSLMGTVILLGVLAAVMYCLWIQRARMRQCYPKPASNVQPDQMEATGDPLSEMPETKTSFATSAGTSRMSEPMFQELLQSLRNAGPPMPTAPTFQELRLKLVDSPSPATSGETPETV